MRFIENSKLEIWFFKLLGIKLKPCGHYDRFEQCCNDYNYCTEDTGLSFCEAECPYGVGGDKRLPISQLRLNLIRWINRNIIYRKYYK